GIDMQYGGAPEYSAGATLQNMSRCPNHSVLATSRGVEIHPHDGGPTRIVRDRAIACGKLTDNGFLVGVYDGVVFSIAPDGTTAVSMVWKRGTSLLRRHCSAFGNELAFTDGEGELLIISVAPTGSLQL